MEVGSADAEDATVNPMIATTTASKAANVYLTLYMSPPFA